MQTFDGINHYASSNTSSPLPPQKRKKRWWKWLAVILILVGGGVAISSSHIISKTNKIFTNKQNIFTRVSQLLVSDDKPLKGEDGGQVNILLLGMGGPGHEGPNLTDTMIVASINTTTKDVVFTSIPRDFLVQLPGRGFNKINAAYAYAEREEPGSGGAVAIGVAEKVTGLNIPYFASIDFKGFVKAVDHVGGLDITIDRTFTDSSYPNYNYGYLAPQTFVKGSEYMNGERALIFARSRKGTNGEGSDFARSERQKKIMVALRDELFKLDVTNLSTLNNLLGDFTENFRTNLEPFELKRLATLGKDISGDNAFSTSLDPDNLYICDGLIDLNTGRPSAALPPPPPPTTTINEDGTETVIPAPAPVPEPNTRIYVVQPCEGQTLADINNHLKDMIFVAKLQKEDATIEIQNTTGKAYVLEPWKALAQNGLDITFTTSKTPLETSILYNNTNGAKPKTLDYIKTNYSFTASDLPYTSSKADFVIILGKDAL